MSAGALRWLRWALLGGALAVCLMHASGLVPLRFLQQLDLAIDDARLRATVPGSKDTRIVIVDVDDASLARIGRWPWPRERLAALAEELFERQQVALLGFDMVFAEALWAELSDQGVDVVGLILGKTDTPALRRLEAERGTLASEDHVPADAASVDSVIAEAFENLENGPTVFVGDMMRAAAQVMGSLTRKQAVEMFAAASRATMGD